MFLRALALLILLCLASVALSAYFGTEILAALGAILAQLKVVAAKIAALSSRSVLIWLKAQGINFARVEIAKRWMTRSLIPLLIGAAAQRRIAEFSRHYVSLAQEKYDAMIATYRAQPRPTRILLVLIAIAATLAVTVSTLSLWLIVFSVQAPLWILAGLAAFSRVIWVWLQKLAFRSLAFMQIFQVWGFLRRRMPPEYLARLRRFNFRVARIVVRRRRMTLSQLAEHKDGLGMRLSLIREYFRQDRPEGPSAAEFEAMHRRDDRQA